MWYQLFERNDWEYITVHIGGPVVGGRFGTNLELEECPPLLKAGSYRVRWPDGHEQELKVVMRSYSKDYSDMGHTYTAKGDKPYFVIAEHGARHLVYAPDLGVEVWR